MYVGVDGCVDVCAEVCVDVGADVDTDDNGGDGESNDIIASERMIFCLFWILLAPIKKKS